jgi:hypothetical protein
MVLAVRRWTRPNGLPGESEGMVQFRKLYGVLGVANNEEVEVNGEEGGKERDTCRHFGPRGDDTEQS